MPIKFRLLERVIAVYIGGLIHDKIYILFVNIDLDNFYWFMVAKYQVYISRSFQMRYAYIFSILYVIACI